MDLWVPKSEPLSAADKGVSFRELLASSTYKQMLTSQRETESYKKAICNQMHYNASKQTWIARFEIRCGREFQCLWVCSLKSAESSIHLFSIVMNYE
jgi:hypothetical protein